MKYRCLNEECGKEFLFPAKVELTEYDMSQLPSSIVRTQVCPYCNSKDIDSFVEPKEPEYRIVDAASVPKKKVRELTLKGWEVHPLYLVNVTMANKEEVSMIKREIVKEEQPETLASHQKKALKVVNDSLVQEEFDVEKKWSDLEEKEVKQ